MSAIQIIGRRSSVFTRLPLMFAVELGVPHEFAAIGDMRKLDPGLYANNPALKLPILRHGNLTVFGAQNICRIIAENASQPPQVVWPEDLRDALSRNAQELVWHCMSAQVQIVMGTVLCKLPPDNVFFVKARAGLEGSLAWLDEHLESSLALLPGERRLSLYEVALFALIEHLQFRATVDMSPHAALLRFAGAYGLRQSARRTAYSMDG